MNIARFMVVCWFLPAAVLAAVRPFDGPPVTWPKTPIDQLVFGQLKTLNIEPAPLCADAVFVRRAYLDVIGTLPTAQETREFLADASVNKRAALVEKLLARPEFADYWSLKWCDLLRVKSEFPINLWPNAVQAYHRWIHAALRENMPYDRFARELLTASGSNFRTPPVNFYRAVQGKEPAVLAQTVALTFMGARADKWPTNTLAGLSAFFWQVGYKSTGEWKEEIVFDDADKATNAPVAIFPDGTRAKFDDDQDPREAFANWLIRPQNPWFTRNIANRVWYWLLGRGIIHEPDDIRADNPPVNPALLAYLEKELIGAQYDLKHLYRLILNSQAYQLSSIPATNTVRAVANFASYPVRRLEAEVLIDAINQITGGTENYSSPIPEPFTYIPENQRSIVLADGSITGTFLELYGRSARDTGLLAERNNQPSAAQRLHLLNSSHIRRKLDQGPKLRALLAGKQTRRELATSLYLTILSRRPTEEELQIAEDYAQTHTLGADLAWALINTAEFQYRH